MKKALKPFCIVLVLAAIAVVGGLLLLRSPMTDVPDEREIRRYQRLKPFILEDETVTGIYRNHDVDSLVFTYRTRLDSPETFWRGLDNELVDSKWVQLEAKPLLRRYEKVIPRGDEMFCSSEEVRVGFCKDQRTVVVTWVQGDTLKDVKSFSEADESRFAEQQVWPIFQKLLSAQ